MTKNKRSTGTYYEDLAVRYLESHGVIITERNYRCRKGEIDLIGFDSEDGQKCLVFFEVKYRMTMQCGYAAEAVGYAKQKKICRVSDSFRMINGIYDDVQVRYDVVAFDGEDVTWIKNAFEYVRG